MVTTSCQKQIVAIFYDAVSGDTGEHLDRGDRSSEKPARRHRLYGGNSSKYHTPAALSLIATTRRCGFQMVWIMRNLPSLLHTGDSSWLCVPLTFSLFTSDLAARRDIARLQFDVILNGGAKRLCFPGTYEKESITVLGYFLHSRSRTLALQIVQNGIVSPRFYFTMEHPLERNATRAQKQQTENCGH